MNKNSRHAALTVQMAAAGGALPAVAGPHIAMHALIDSPDDGQVLMLTANSIAANPALHQPAPFDPAKDVTPIARELQKTKVVAAPSVMAAAEMLRTGELDAFATHKDIFFDISDRVPGSRVLDGRFSLEQLAVGGPKGRSAAAAYLQDFAADAGTQALVQQAALRSGLRGLVPAQAR